jgi:hypothetical protein
MILCWKAHHLMLFDVIYDTPSSMGIYILQK